MNFFILLCRCTNPEQKFGKRGIDDDGCPVNFKKRLLNVWEVEGGHVNVDVTEGNTVLPTPTTVNGLDIPTTANGLESSIANSIASSIANSEDECPKIRTNKLPANYYLKKYKDLLDSFTTFITSFENNSDEMRSVLSDLFDKCALNEKECMESILSKVEIPEDRDVFKPGMSLFQVRGVEELKEKLVSLLVTGFCSSETQSNLIENTQSNLIENTQSNLIENTQSNLIENTQSNLIENKETTNVLAGSDRKQAIRNSDKELVFLERHSDLVDSIKNCREAALKLKKNDKTLTTSILFDKNLLEMVEFTVKRLGFNMVVQGYVKLCSHNKFVRVSTTLCDKWKDSFNKLSRLADTSLGENEARSIICFLRSSGLFKIPKNVRSQAPYNSELKNERCSAHTKHCEILVEFAKIQEKAAKILENLGTIRIWNLEREMKNLNALIYTRFQIISEFFTSLEDFIFDETLRKDLAGREYNKVASGERNYILKTILFTFLDSTKLEEYLDSKKSAIKFIQD